MVQTELHRMQGLAAQLHRQVAAAAVGGIPHNRVAEVGAVHPDLVGSAGVELEAQQGVGTEPLDQAPVGAGMPTRAVLHHRVFLAIDRMAADGADDRAGIPRRRSVHHRQVFT